MGVSDAELAALKAEALLTMSEARGAGSHLNKPGVLTPAEFTKIHTVVGLRFSAMSTFLIRLFNRSSSSRARDGRGIPTD